MKDKYFGDNPSERQAKYAADLALLTEVYNREIIAAGNNAKEKAHRRSISEGTAGPHGAV